MSFSQILKTLYVFKDKKHAVLKQQLNGTFKIIYSSLDSLELKEFLSCNGYLIS